MEAKELQIGDWVDVLAHFLDINIEGTATSGNYNLCHKYCRIVGIAQESIAIGKICSDMISFKPIPITEEILKANGWELHHYKSEEFDEYRYKHMAPMFMLAKEYEHYSIMNGDSAFANIRYVHELQHALRLCGLNTLADEFKIE